VGADAQAHSARAPERMMVRQNVFIYASF